jgi:hypothetical protein
MMVQKTLVKWNYRLADEFFKNKGFMLVDKKPDDTEFHTKLKVSFCDNEKYFYHCSLNNLLRNNPRKIDLSNPYSIHNIKLWCSNNYKPFILLSDIYEGNGKKLKWKCLKEDCGEIFESSWGEINSGSGCPFCVCQRVGLSNCLATINPELASEWHPTKNGNLTPYDVSYNSGKDIWWKCSKNPNHEWKTSVCNRAYNNSGCPCCIGKKASKDYNLFLNNPELCEEWDYVKNKKKPEEYTPCSNKKVSWICKECGCEWDATINDRNGINKQGCPNCSVSKGEKRIKKFLNTYKLFDVQQKQFDNLIGLGGKNLSYDFYLPKYNLLIEYQGIQHEKYISGLHKSKKDFEKQQEHDRRKREYAKRNNINLLEIWYWDFDSIEEILSKTLQ